MRTPLLIFKKEVLLGIFLFIRFGEEVLLFTYSSSFTFLFWERTDFVVHCYRKNSVLNLSSIDVSHCLNL